MDDEDVIYTVCPCCGGDALDAGWDEVIKVTIDGASTWNVFSCNLCNFPYESNEKISCQSLENSV